MADTATQNGHAADIAKELLGRTQRIEQLREVGWKLVLDDGQWVQLRDPRSLTEGQRSRFKEVGATAELLNSKMSEALVAGNDLMVAALAERFSIAVMKANRVSIAMFVDAWSFTIPVPNATDPEPLGQLPGPVFDRLSTVTEDLVTEAFLDPKVSTRVDSPFVGFDD